MRAVVATFFFVETAPTNSRGYQNLATFTMGTSCNIALLLLLATAVLVVPSKADNQQHWLQVHGAPSNSSILNAPYVAAWGNLNVLVSSDAPDRSLGISAQQTLVLDIHGVSGPRNRWQFMTFGLRGNISVGAIAAAAAVLDASSLLIHRCLSCRLRTDVRRRKQIRTRCRCRPGK